MRQQKKNSGVITIQSPFSVSPLKVEECKSDVKELTEGRSSLSSPNTRTRSTFRSVRPGKGNEASSCGPKQPPKQCVSHPSFRQLQAQMEAGHQQMQEIIQPLVDIENGFMKDLESFLSQRDVAELRRKKLLHKSWTEHVWFPLQKRVEEHMLSCSSAEAKRRQSLYSHYIHHCNTKGFVFLDTYDLREYNPFLLNFTKQHYFKERLKEKRMSASSEAGCKYAWRKVEELPQRNYTLNESVMSQANKLPRSSSSHPVPTSRKIPVEDDPKQRKSSRINTIPLYIRATATSDGRCHQTSCWFSRCGYRQQAASL